MSATFQVLLFVLAGLVPAYFLFKAKKPAKEKTWEESLCDHETDFTTHVPGMLWSIDVFLPMRRPPFPRKMVIYKLKDSDDLWIHSPAVINEELMQKLNHYGRVAHLVVPNSMHTLDYRVWSKRFPEAQISAPSFLVPKLDHAYSIESCEAKDSQNKWPGIEIIPTSNFELSYKLALRSSEEKAIVVADLFFNLNESYGFIVDYVLRSSGGLKITPLGKWVLWFLGVDMKKLPQIYRDHFCQDHVRFLLMAHGDVITDNPSKQISEKILAHL